jgi:class 3 adenylate cyclase
MTQDSVGEMERSLWGPSITGLDGSPFALPTGTVTFLLTDVEGSTRQWEAAPDSMAVAIARHYAILE